MTGCTHKSHAQYADALESARVQAVLISREALEANDNVAEGVAVDWTAVMAGIQERAEFARRAMEKAEAATNQHFDQGCINLPPMTEAELRAAWGDR